MPGQFKDSLTVVDAHVHIHECYDLSQFFDAAYANCQSVARQKGHENDFTGVILLTESLGIHWFQHFATLGDKGDLIKGCSNNQWHFRPTDEPSSLIAQSNNGSKLIIVAGRQIVAMENLEVLALLTEKTFPDGTSMRETIEAVRNCGGIPAVPWGFGKWWGKRGKMLSDLLPSQKGKVFFLGDNSSRPGFLPYPSQFTQGEQLGIRVLPGSDPLPFPSEYWRPCSAGFSILGKIQDRTPTEDLKRIMMNPQTTFFPHIVPEAMFRFFKNQFAMHLLKHSSSPQS